MVDISAELPSHPDYLIRGDVVLGVRDPRIMNEAEFKSSPDLLYHGAAAEFTYSPLGEFDINSTTGSTDFGSGFYATDNLNQAASYSLVRSFNTLTKPIVYLFLPYNARMLNVRSASDPLKNGFLPRKFVEDWLVFLDGFLNDDANFAEFNEFLKEVYQKGARKDFLERVQKALDENKPVNIRDRINSDNTSIFTKDGNGVTNVIFRKFMLSKGYDGMIYREGGEGKDAKALTGYVFYNSRVVDTWEGWRKRKE